MLFNFSAILDLFFPRSSLIKEIEKLSPSQLRRRAKPPAEMRLTALRDIPLATTAIFSYRQPIIRQAVWELKYRGNQKIARLFGHLITEELEKIKVFTPKNMLVIPLPNSATRRRERGWNQTELIAAHISTSKNSSQHITIRTDILRKVRHTTPQADLKNRQRLTNLSDCFNLNKTLQDKIPPDSLIVLLDDVTTTGATFAEAIKPFLAIGLTDIYCLAIAH